MKQHVAADRWKWGISLFGAGTFALWAICIPQAIETIETGKPVTGFLKFGDSVQIEMKDAQGASIFGTIEQTVTHYRERR